MNRNSGGPPRKPRFGDTTVPDPTTTNQLAQRVRREVALEKASDEVARAAEASDAHVVVVLGPDGIPQIADAPDEAPETRRVELPEDEPPPAKKRP